MKKEKLTREKLQRLMSRVKQSADTADPPVQAAEFDWMIPHRFGSEARGVLEGLGKRLAASIQKGLEQQSHSSPEVELANINEHIASRLAQKVTQQENPPYVIGLKNETKQCIGCMLFSYASASLLVAQMLHDPEAAVGQDGQFSALEESILTDLSTVLTENMQEVLQEQLQWTLQSTGTAVRGDWVMKAAVLEDLCEMVFKFKFKQQEETFSIVLESSLLDLYVGIPVRPGESPDKVSSRILERLRRAPVQVSACICSGRMNLDDLMDLKEGDLIVLDKKINQPFNVLLNGRACLYAYPAVCREKLALVITEEQEEYE